MLVGCMCVYVHVCWKWELPDNLSAPAPFLIITWISEDSPSSYVNCVVKASGQKVSGLLMG